MPAKSWKISACFGPFRNAYEIASRADGWRGNGKAGRVSSSTKRFEEQGETSESAPQASRLQNKRVGAAAAAVAALTLCLLRACTSARLGKTASGCSQLKPGAAAAISGCRAATLARRIAHAPGSPVRAALTTAGDWTRCACSSSALGWAAAARAKAETDKEGGRGETMERKRQSLRDRHSVATWQQWGKKAEDGVQ